MYPTKNTLEYMAEMDRLFQRMGDRDILQSSPTPSIHLQSYNHAMQSSSSNDTSPDTFPDMTAHRFTDQFHNYEAEYPKHSVGLREPRTDQFHNYEAEYPKHSVGLREHRTDQFVPHGEFEYKLDQFVRHEYKQRSELETLHEYENPSYDRHRHLMSRICETPSMVRPIVGRKIEIPTNAQEYAFEKKALNICPVTPFPQVSPQMERQALLNHNLYELFPAEAASGFSTPVKSSQNIFNTSPRASNMSPQMTSDITSMLTSMTNTSPSPSNIPRIPEMFSLFPELSPTRSRRTSSGSSASYSPRLSTPFKEPLIGLNTSFRQNAGPSKMCTFCRKNGETPLVYMTHAVKEKIGNKNVVTCPILRSLVCSTCGSSGDNAHTITYCPVLRSTNNGQPLKSTTVTLKNTRIKSNGRRRY